MVFSSHRRASQRAASAFWVALTASSTTPTGPVISAGSVQTGPGTMIGSASSGRKFDLRSRGPPADQYLVPGGGQVRGDRRADGARTHNCNIHDDPRN